MKFTQADATASKEILFNDHYVGMPYMVTAEGVEAGTDGKKIVKAGTILPANDETADGVLLHDVDVTYGDAPGTLVIHGFLDNIKITENGIQVKQSAADAMPQITFIGGTIEDDSE